MPRAERNTELLQALTDVLTEHPDLRFGQALLCLGIIEPARDEHGEPRRTPGGRLLMRDPFHEEPGETVLRMRATLARAQEQQAARRSTDPHVQSALHRAMHGVQHP